MGMIWAVTRHTLLRALRQKTAPVIILGIVLAGPGLSMFLEGDLQLTGLLKTVFTFNVAIAAAALMFLTLFLSTTTLHGDIAGKQIFLLDTKPIPRWQTLVGMWLGIVILQAWLLLLAGVGCYLATLAFASAGRWTVWGWARQIFFWTFLTGAVLWLLSAGHGFLRRRRPSGAYGRLWAAGAVVTLLLGAWGLADGIRSTPRRTDTRGQDAMDVWRQLLVARRSFRPPAPDIQQTITQRLARLRAEGRDYSGWDPRELERQLVEDVNKKTWRIPYGGSATFSFESLPPETHEVPEFMIRYKLHAFKDGTEGGNLFGVAAWELRGHDNAPMTGQRLAPFKSGRPEEFAVDSTVLAGERRMDVTILNLGEMDTNAPITVFVPLADGLELLAPTGTFVGNIAKAYGLLWIRLAMLAAFGLLANTFMGGPVSAFFLFGLICLGQFNTAALKNILPERIEGMPEPEVSAMGTLFQGGARLVMSIVPNFDQTNPTDDLLAGREIGWWRLLRQLFFDVGLRGGLAALMGFWCYQRREVGLPTYV